MQRNFAGKQKTKICHHLSQFLFQKTILAGKKKNKNTREYKTTSKSITRKQETNEFEKIVPEINPKRALEKMDLESSAAINYDTASIGRWIKRKGKKKKKTN